MKTIKLGDRPRIEHERASDILTGAMLIAVLLFARLLLNGPHTEAQTISQPTALPAIIIIATQPAIVPPTAVPAPTSAPIYIEVPAPPPPPVVQFVEVPVYVNVPVYVEAPAAPTPEPVIVAEPPQLQTIAVSPDEEMSPAILREMMDQ